MQQYKLKLPKVDISDIYGIEPKKKKRQLTNAQKLWC